MGISDISADYRKYIIKLINQGEYDQAPQFKNLAIDHMERWQKWADACTELTAYGPFKMIFMFPWFISLNGRVGRLYSELTASQNKLTKWGVDNPEEFNKVHESRALKVMTTEGPVQ